MATDPYERIRPGMEVRDLAGDQIGTVSGIQGRLPNLYRTGDLEPVGRNMEAKRAGMGEGGHLEMHYRGRKLYVPLTEVDDVRGDVVVLAVDREAVDQQGWDAAPTTSS
ncbi:MAG: DUF2171 domain-containing protein [Chloroflexi bacterium]|nr:DUF2171 domain-containing protein [Chloroflexota bacterium]